MEQFELRYCEICNMGFFPKNPRQKYCAECSAKIQKEKIKQYYQKNKERINAYRRKYYRQKRQESKMSDQAVTKKNQDLTNLCGKRCRACRYHGKLSGVVICDYLSITGRRRGCHVGDCDKYEKGRRKKCGLDLTKHID